MADCWRDPQFVRSFLGEDLVEDEHGNITRLPPLPVIVPAPTATTSKLATEIYLQILSYSDVGTIAAFSATSKSSQALVKDLLPDYAGLVEPYVSNLAMKIKRGKLGAEFAFVGGREHSGGLETRVKCRPMRWGFALVVEALKAENCLHCEEKESFLSAEDGGQYCIKHFWEKSGQPEQIVVVKAPGLLRVDELRFRLIAIDVSHPYNYTATWPPNFIGVMSEPTTKYEPSVSIYPTVKWEYSAYMPRDPRDDDLAAPSYEGLLKLRELFNKVSARSPECAARVEANRTRLLAAVGSSLPLRDEGLVDVLNAHWHRILWIDMGFDVEKATEEYDEWKKAKRAENAARSAAIRYGNNGAAPQSAVNRDWAVASLNTAPQSAANNARAVANLNTAPQSAANNARAVANSNTAAKVARYAAARAGANGAAAQSAANNAQAVVNLKTAWQSGVNSARAIANLDTASQSGVNSTESQLVVDNGQPAANSTAAQPVARNIAAQRVANDVGTQPAQASTNAVQPLDSNITVQTAIDDAQSVANNTVSQFLANSLAALSVANGTIATQPVETNTTGDSVANSTIAEPVANRTIAQPAGNRTTVPEEGLIVGSTTVHEQPVPNTTASEQPPAATASSTHAPRIFQGAELVPGDYGIADPSTYVDPDGDDWLSIPLPDRVPDSPSWRNES